MAESSFLPPHGNYAELLSYQKAEIVYDITSPFLLTSFFPKETAPSTR